MNISAAISEAAARLESSGVEEPRREAATIAAFALGRDRTYVFAHPEYELSGDEAEVFGNALERRVSREPFHYITGVKEFYGLEFRVRPGVLIPRPETELLVEEAISILGTVPQPRFLEIGVGSGCISVAILKNLGSARAVVTDISTIALDVARQNAAVHGVADRIDFRYGETYADVDGRFDIIVSNPPYIPDGERSSLATDVAAYEPPEALFGGEDGLSVVSEIVRGAAARLATEGSLLMEIGAGQAGAVTQMLERGGLREVKFRRDLQGIARVATAKM